jgi:hypothetical protein
MEVPRYFHGGIRFFLWIMRVLNGCPCGLIFGAIGRSVLAYVGGTFVSALGIFSTVFGFYVAVHYAHQYNNLLRELERTL